MQYESIPRFPGGEGFFGHAREIQRDRLGFVKRLASTPLALQRLESELGIPVCIVNDPALVHELLVERAGVFQKSNVLRFSLYPLAGEGLFTANGELWKRQRRRMAPLFHPAQLERYAGDMVSVTSRAMAGWADGQTVEVAREMTRITMGVAGKALFDTDTFDEADALGRALTVALEWTADNAPSPLALLHILPRQYMRLAAEVLPDKLSALLRRVADRLEGPVVLPGSDGRALREAIAVLDARVQRMIDLRRASPTSVTSPEAPKDLLSRLLAARDEDGSRMSDKQVRDEVLTLFVAGHETTAAGLSWALYLLARHPRIQEAIEREVDAIGAEPTARDLPRLGLSLRVFKEALRLYPPVYIFARQASSNTTLGGYPMARLTVALVSPYALHHRADLWPDPERFDPERFLPEAEAVRSRLSWMPFGAGPRVCIGNHFAMMEGQLVLARLLHRFRFERGPDTPPDPGATLRPTGPMPVRVTLRHGGPLPTWRP